MDQAEAFPPRRYAEWHLLLGAIVLIAAAWACWQVAKLWTAPSADEAMRLSLAQLGRPELAIAYTLHPDACSITRTTWKWNVACEGVPIHFYQDRVICDPGSPRTCSPAPSDNENCRSFYWEVDLDGRPSNPIGDRGRSASIMASCAPKGTQAADRAEMMKRGITPTRVEVTGKQ